MVFSTYGLDLIPHIFKPLAPSVPPSLPTPLIFKSSITIFHSALTQLASSRKKEYTYVTHLIRSIIYSYLKYSLVFLPYPLKNFYPPSSQGLLILFPNSFRDFNFNSHLSLWYQVQWGTTSHPHLHLLSSLSPNSFFHMTLYKAEKKWNSLFGPSFLLLG